MTMQRIRMGMEMGMGALMVELARAPFATGLKDPSQKMVKVVGSTLSQVGLAPVMNQEKELPNVSPQQNEQA